MWKYICTDSEISFRNNYQKIRDKGAYAADYSCTEYNVISPNNLVRCLSWDMHLHATALSDYDIRRINSRNRRIRTRVPYVDDQGRPLGYAFRKESACSVPVHRVRSRFLFWPQQHDASQDHYTELPKNDGTGVLMLSNTLNVFF